MFGSIVGILSASPEAEGRAFAERHSRRHEVVVGIDNTVVVVVALAEDAVGRTVVAVTSAKLRASKLPAVAARVATVDGRPASRHASIEVDGEFVAFAAARTWARILFAPPDLDLVGSVHSFSVDRFARSAAALTAVADRAAHRPTVVVVGQGHFARIDRADAVLVLAKLTFNGVFAVGRTSEGHILAIFSDQEADDVDRRQDTAVGAASAANSAEVDVASLVRVVGDDEDVVLASLSSGRNHAVLSGLCGVAAADDLV